MNTKPIPAIITLLAGLVTCIVIFLNKYEFLDGMKTLLTVVIIFYIIGLLLKAILNKVFNPVVKKTDLEETGAEMEEDTQENQEVPDENAKKEREE